ncbi:MAG: peptidoglycan D,D-transpeptidase FtsI family protein [Patescibacteria group bacterium]
MRRHLHTPQRKQQPTRRRDRIDYLMAAIFVFGGLISVRLADIQIFQHAFYEALAADQHNLYEQLSPKRGDILVHDKDDPDNLYPLATNTIEYLVYAEPMRVTDVEGTLEQLASVLEFTDEEKADLAERLKRENDLYEPVKKQVDEETMNKIKAMNLAGIEFQEEYDRYYPEKTVGSQVLGFVGYAGDTKIGQYGIEGFWDEELAGEPGFLQAEKDAQGRWITFGTKLLQKAKDGDDIVLTIDRTIEYEACKRLDEAVLKHGADGGSVIITDPHTGAIKAMCGSPNFDPNAYNETEDVNAFLNPSTFYIYEPGSVFKPIVMAAALDSGAVTPDTTYEDTGAVEIGRYTIKNFDGKAHGVNTMVQVLEQSLNTGMIFVSRQMQPATMEDYIKNFGFGQKYGIQLNSEAQGDISSLATHQDIYMATGSFGQGLSVTPLQLVAAYGAIANGGVLMKPYIVDEVIKSEDASVITEPTEIRRVISPQTSTTLGAMLVKVVQNGHGQKAGVPGYFVAGKTGTAQVPREDGPGYDPSHTIGTFCGFAPADNPVFTMCVKIDKPRDVQFAESTAAPLFGDLAQFLLNYYDIPPDPSAY